MKNSIEIFLKITGYVCINDIECKERERERERGRYPSYFFMKNIFPLNQK